MGDSAKKIFGHESLHRFDSDGRQMSEIRPKSNYLEIKNLVKEYGDFTALKDISLDIKNGS